MGSNVIGRSQSKHSSQALYPTPKGEKPRFESSVRLFDGLNSGDITRILASGIVRRVEAGGIIVHANEPGTHLYLLTKGSVNYFRETSEGKQILIIRLSPGDAFGLGTLLPKPAANIGTAEAVRETELLVWDHSSNPGVLSKAPAPGPKRSANRFGIHQAVLGSACRAHQRERRGEDGRDARASWNSGRPTHCERC